MSPEGKSKVGTFFTTLPGIITAIAALLTATVGAVVALRPDNPETPAATTPAAPSITRPADSQTSDKPSPRPDSSPSTSPSKPSKPTPQAIDTTAPHDAGSLAMEHGDLVDLSRGTVSKGMAPFDFIVQRDVTNDKVDLASGMGAVAAPIQGSVSKSTCRQALGPRRDSLLNLTVESIGVWTCVLTRDGKFAAIRPDEVDPMTGSAKVSYVVWK